MHDKGRWLQGTKAGGRSGGSEGRQEAGDSLGLLDRRTGIAGSLPVRRPDTLLDMLDMLDIEDEALDEESGPYLGLNILHMEFVPRSLKETFCCFGGKWGFYN